MLAGASSLAPTTSALAPGALGARIRPAELPKDTIRLGSTGFYPVSSLKQDGVALERRPGGVAVAVRRGYRGSVIDWLTVPARPRARLRRWYIGGIAWWTRIIGSVAYVPLIAGGRPDGQQAGAGAVARLVGRLGPPRPTPPTGPTHGPIDRRILLTLIMILLLLEWASRRWRGLR